MSTYIHTYRYNEAVVASNMIGLPRPWCFHKTHLGIVIYIWLPHTSKQHDRLALYLANWFIDHVTFSHQVLDLLRDFKSFLSWLVWIRKHMHTVLLQTRNQNRCLQKVWLLEGYWTTVSSVLAYLEGYAGYFFHLRYPILKVIGLLCALCATLSCRLLDYSFICATLSC